MARNKKMRRAPQEKSPTAARSERGERGASLLRARIAAALLSPDTLWVAFWFLVGLALRLYRVGERSLWTDETDTIYFSVYSPTKPFFGEPHYLYWMLVFPFIKFSFTATALRMVSVICGALCVPAGYALGRLWSGRWSGRVLAAMMAISPYLIFYSREARYYSAMILVSTLSLVLLTLFLRNRRWWSALLLIFLQVVGYGIHPTMLLFTAALFIFAALSLGASAIRVIRGGNWREAIANWRARQWIALVAVAGVMIAMGVLAPKFSVVPVREIFTFDTGRRAGNVDLSFDFFVRPFLRFVQTPIVDPSVAAYVLFLSSWVAGFVLLLKRKSSGAWIFIVTWSLAHAALWIFPSDNDYRVKYISFLFPLVLAHIAAAWSAAIEAGLRRFSDKLSIRGALIAAGCVIVVPHLFYAVPLAKILSEPRNSFGVVADTVREHADRAPGTPQYLFCGMPGFYGLRGEWEIAGFPIRHLAYFRDLRYRMDENEGAAMARHLLARPGNKWWCVIEAGEIPEETQSFVDRFAQGFQHVITGAPAIYDLWHYEVPLSIWKHHTSMIMPPGPSFVSFVENSESLRNLDLNIGDWEPAGRKWTREIYIAAEANYQFSVIGAEGNRQVAIPMAKARLRSLGSEGAGIILQTHDGEAAAIVPDGFYRIEVELAGREPINPSATYLQVDEVNEGTLTYRSEFLTAVERNEKFVIRQVTEDRFIAMVPFGLRIAYDIWVPEEGDYTLSIEPAISPDSGVLAEIEGWIDNQPIGVLQTPKMVENTPQMDYREAQARMSAGVHRVVFLLKRPSGFEGDSRFAIWPGFKLKLVQSP